MLTTGGACTINSNAGTLTINPLADITTQPAGVAICAGASTSFTVADDNNPVVTARQWQVSTNNGSTWSNLTNTGIYTGVTTANLILTNVSTAYDTYLYHCVLTTAGPCPITSSNALLTVHPLPANKTVNASDFALCYNTGTNINLLASENNIVSYQLRNGARQCRRMRSWEPMVAIWHFQQEILQLQPHLTFMPEKQQR